MQEYRQIDRNMSDSMIIVPSGGMEISRKNILQACLGSCVGLAIHDPRAMTGGMVHLLLPKPICNIPESHNGYYASRGVDMLVSAMKMHGAKTNNMVAYIAGGALIDPISPTDLRLNLGGQTLDITLDLLRREKIRIAKVEAGGTMPCIMSLDTTTGECSIQTNLENYTPPENIRFTAPSGNVLVESIEKILPVPQTTLRISHMLNDENYDIARVSSEVKKDQVITAKVLRLCNSSYISPAKKISSIEQALVHLGNRLMFKIIITAQVEKYLDDFDAGYSLCRGGMYYHALGTALISERIAEITKKTQPDTAYTAGLLHDIGKIVLDRHIASIHPLFYRSIMKSGRESTEIENDLLKTNHAETGKLLAEQWNFPPSITDVISSHHNPGGASDHEDLVNIVYLADVLMNRFHTDFEIEHMGTKGIEYSLEKLGLDARELFESIKAAGYRPGTIHAPASPPL